MRKGAVKVEVICDQVRKNVGSCVLGELAENKILGGRVLWSCGTGAVLKSKSRHAESEEWLLPK